MQPSNCNTQRNSILHRRAKRALIAEFFFAHLNRPISSADLHAMFGSSLRTRISELNRDPAGELRISNHTYCTPAGEVSTYTAIRRNAQPTLFPILQPERQHRDDG